MTFLNCFRISHAQGLDNRTGAIFGMDARIALIIASVLAAAGGLTLMSRLERSKAEMAERNLHVIRDALENYYKTNTLGELPRTLDAVLQSGLVNEAGLDKDPWNQSWKYIPISAIMTILDVPVKVQMAVITSNGKNKLDESAAIFNESDYGSWVSGGDDVGIKFSSIDIERERVEQHRERGKMIVDKLTEFENRNYLQADSACGSTEAPMWCKDYKGKNHTQFNYYPRSDLDDNADVIYFTDAGSEEGGKTYISGDITDMQDLMRAIGLPASYGVDPWGRTLYYQSNASNRSDPPFSASICFSYTGNCFEEIK